MQTYLRLFVCCVITLFFSGDLDAQGSSTTVQADSIQRIMMRDSLQISDSLITEVLVIKHNYFTQTEQIRSNVNLTTSQQNSEMATLRTQTTNNLKSLLGNEIYERYTQMIARRMRPGSLGVERRPLAEGTGN
ncbi:MAG: hypothetical protein ABI688_01110 [Bacteroidota bacterium]